MGSGLVVEMKNLWPTPEEVTINFQRLYGEERCDNDYDLDNEFYDGKYDKNGKQIRGTDSSDSRENDCSGPVHLYLLNSQTIGHTGNFFRVLPYCEACFKAEQQNQHPDVVMSYRILDDESIAKLKAMFEANQLKDKLSNLREYLTEKEIPLDEAIEYIKSLMVERILEE